MTTRESGLPERWHLVRWPDGVTLISRMSRGEWFFPYHPAVTCLAEGTTREAMEAALRLLGGK